MRALTQEEVDLLAAGVDLLIDRGEKHVQRGRDVERIGLLGREQSILIGLRDELRVRGVAMLP